jgi:SAM-dependent methyltransferase
VLWAGIVAAGLHPAGANTTGLDFSPAMLELARQAVPNVEFVKSDAKNLTFDNNNSDVVTIGFGILRAPDPISVLTDSRRVLRPGGRLAFSVWYGPSIPTVLGDLFQVIGRHGDPSVQLPPGPGLHDYADPKIVGPALRTAGFSDFSQTVVHNVVETNNVDDIVTLFMEGTVLGGILLRSQPPDALTNIRAAMIAQIRSMYGKNGPWRLPIPSVVSAETAD